MVGPSLDLGSVQMGTPELVSRSFTPPQARDGWGAVSYPSQFMLPHPVCT